MGKNTSGIKYSKVEKKALPTIKGEEVLSAEKTEAVNGFYGIIVKTKNDSTPWYAQVRRQQDDSVVRSLDPTKLKRVSVENLEPELAGFFV